MVDPNQHNNFVVPTNILKSLEVLEDKARKEWHEKWGFYLDFPKVILDEAKKRNITEEKYRQILNRKKENPIAYQDDNVTIVKRSDTIPITSSGFIGWRSDPKHSLEFLGPLYVSPKHTLPYQPPYYVIKLG